MYHKVKCNCWTLCRWKEPGFCISIQLVLIQQTLSWFQALYLFIISVSTVTMASVYSTGLRVRKISSIFLKNSSEKKRKYLPNGKSQFKFGELVKMRNSFLLEDKNPKTFFFVNLFFSFWTSDKNLETQKHGLDPSTDSIKQILKFPLKNPHAVQYEI